MALRTAERAAVLTRGGRGGEGEGGGDAPQLLAPSSLSLDVSAVPSRPAPTYPRAPPCALPAAAGRVPAEPARHLPALPAFVPPPADGAGPGRAGPGRERRGGQGRAGAGQGERRWPRRPGSAGRTACSRQPRGRSLMHRAQTSPLAPANRRRRRRLSPPTPHPLRPPPRARRAAPPPDGASAPLYRAAGAPPAASARTRPAPHRTAEGRAARCRSGPAEARPARRPGSALQRGGQYLPTQQEPIFLLRKEELRGLSSTERCHRLPV
ncbi:translation initiation factor IF-2-like isoform X1 [Grus americana]|uniref:translation initiation factor IF-2-like isoform X1 n=1 Tax=Grus americana TaxID=9117 RepID=UPI0024083491|nr:translation initiation factor IF-2-like isoform X1 [Grus americana]